MYIHCAKYFSITCSLARIFRLFQDGPENLSFSPPAITYTKTKGDNIPDITCQAECNPACGFAWTKSGNNIPGHSGSTLSLGNLEPDEAGTYTCKATRGSQPMTKSLSIFVIRKLPLLKLKPLC